MNSSILETEHLQAMVELLLSIADDKLMLGHRNAEWTGLGPILEEDIAFSSIAQDELAHAQALYEITATLRGDGRNADALAYGRRSEEYRCAAIVETPDELDWARALLRQIFCDRYDALRLSRLSLSSYAPLAALTSRLRAEEQVHLEHGNGWLERLGRGTDESRDRLQSALNAFGDLAPSLCEPTSGVVQLEASGLYPGDSTTMNRDFLRGCAECLTAAVLRFPSSAFDLAAIPAKGGRNGHHTPGFSELLDELCEVYRLEPNAPW